MRSSNEPSAPSKHESPLFFEVLDLLDELAGDLLLAAEVDTELRRLGGDVAAAR